MREVEMHQEVEDWLCGLSEHEWQRVAFAVDRLAELGAEARMPMSRHLGGGLFELRLALGPTARRITYRFDVDGRIVLLTTFRKQRQNERAELDRARAVAARCARHHT